MQTAPTIPFPQPTPEQPSARPATASLPVWAVGALFGLVVAMVGATVLSVLLWQQLSATEGKVIQLSAEVAGMAERLNNTIATANDNTAQERKALESTQAGLAALTLSTTESMASVQAGIATMRQSTVATAQDTVTHREALRSMDQRFLQMQDLLTAESTTINTLAAGGRNMQRMLKEHDDAIREMAAAAHTAVLQPVSQIPAQAVAQDAPIQASPAQAAPVQVAQGTPAGSPPTIIIDGGNVTRGSLQKSTKSAAPRFPLPVIDVVAQPLPETSALLFNDSK